MGVQNRYPTILLLTFDHDNFGMLIDSDKRSSPSCSAWSILPNEGLLVGKKEKKKTEIFQRASMVAPRLMADRPSPIESKASSIVYTFVGDLRTVSVLALSLRDGLLG